MAALKSCGPNFSPKPALCNAFEKGAPGPPACELPRSRAKRAHAQGVVFACAQPAALLALLARETAAISPLPPLLSLATALHPGSQNAFVVQCRALGLCSTF